MTPISDATLPIIKNTETSLDKQIKNAILDSKYEKMEELNGLCIHAEDFMPTRVTQTSL